MTSETRQFNGRIEPFSKLREFIERFCSAAGVAQQRREELILLIDELSENSTRHGYAATDATEWPLWLTLSVSGGKLAVLYEDAAAPHDPFANFTQPDYSGPPESWRIGGWGVPLISKIAHDLRYERLADRNRVHFTLPLGRLSA
ncbi:MAG: ATP-binding protein [Betaproteobacteria bacterium]